MYVYMFWLSGASFAAMNEIHHQVHRLLSPDGIFILVSLGSRKNRLPFFDPSAIPMNSERSSSNTFDGGEGLCVGDKSGGEMREIKPSSWKLVESRLVGQSQGEAAAGNDHGNQVCVFRIHASLLPLQGI